VALALALAACAPARMVSLPVEAQAFSLLGDTLWSLPVDPQQGPRLIAELQAARNRAMLDPNSLGARLRLARQTAAVGRLRQAVALYDQAYILNPLDPRPALRRGELYLRLREFDLALRDLKYANERAAQQELLEIEDGPDGRPVLVPVRFATAYHLGLARYFTEDYGQARQAFTEALEQATTPDQVVLTALWLYFSASRLGDLREAVGILEQIPANYQVATRMPELQLLRAFRGAYPADSLLRRLFDPPGPNTSTYAYGIGFVLEARGDREHAALAFERGLRAPDWSDPFYIACEVELARRR
jgi:tetratricopeptide (TPR) repeat protein